MLNSLSINLLLMVYGLLIAHILIMYNKSQFGFMMCWTLIVINSWLFFKYLT